MARRNSAGNANADDAVVIIDGGTGNVESAGDNAAGSDDGDGTVYVEPSDFIGSADGSGGSDGSDPGGDPPRRKRGRPRGSGSKRKSAPAQTSSVSVDTDIVSSILFSLHTVASVVAKTPELAVDETEAKQMSDAIAKVSEHYDVQASAKSLAWGNLVLILAMIYGTRFVAIRNRWIEERAAKKSETQEGDDNVITIPGVTGANGMFR